MNRSLVIIASCLLVLPAFADEPASTAKKSEAAPIKVAPVQVAPLQVAAALPEASHEASTSIERAKGEKLATATGHFARARSLLIAAVREFDTGNKLVDPGALLDTQLWRETVMDRAEELEHVLDPQPRATRSGVKYGADTRLLGEAKK